MCLNTSKILLRNTEMNWNPVCNIIILYIFYHKKMYTKNILVQVRKRRICSIHPVGNRRTDIRENTLPCLCLSRKEICLSVTGSGLVDHFGIMVDLP